MAAATHDNDISLVINGISVPFLFIPASRLLSDAKISKTAIEKAKSSDEYDFLEIMEEFEEDYNKSHGRDGSKKPK